MADDPPDYRRGAALQRAVDVHGADTEEEYGTHPALIAVQFAIALVPTALAVTAAAGALLTAGGLRWGLAAPAVLLLWPAAVGLAGLAYQLAKAGGVALVYKDRLVWHRGASFEVVRWDEVEAVYVRTLRDDYQVNFEPPASACRVYLETPAPLARYWREWLEVRTRDGRAVRIPSSVTDYAVLSQTVQQEAFGVLGRAAQAALAGGGPARFGALAVWPDRLEHGGAAVAWADHEDTGPAHGWVTTTALSGRLVGPAVRVEDVPNLALAMSLITDHSASQAASAHRKDDD